MIIVGFTEQANGKWLIHSDGHAEEAGDKVQNDRVCAAVGFLLMTAAHYGSILGKPTPGQWQKGQVQCIVPKETVLFVITALVVLAASENTYGDALDIQAPESLLASANVEGIECSPWPKNLPDFPPFPDPTKPI